MYTDWWQIKGKINIKCLFQDSFSAAIDCTSLWKIDWVPANNPSFHVHGVLKSYFRCEKVYIIKPLKRQIQLLQFPMIQWALLKMNLLEMVKGETYYSQCSHQTIEWPFFLLEKSWRRDVLLQTLRPASKHFSKYTSENHQN